jgi:hypothetical protein
VVRLAEGHVLRKAARGERPGGMWACVPWLC